MHFRVKRLRPDIRLPTKAHPSDTGWDLYSPITTSIGPGETLKVGTGIAIELPVGYGAMVRGRSSQNARGAVVGIGTIDANYRGEIGVTITNCDTGRYHVHEGERLAQLVIERVYDFEMVEVLTLSETDRNDRGFGSSGR